MGNLFSQDEPKKVAGSHAFVNPVRQQYSSGTVRPPKPLQGRVVNVPPSLTFAPRPVVRRLVVHPAHREVTPVLATECQFGKYKCDICGRFWASAQSWANMGQKCKSCKIYVYPYELKPKELQEKAPDFRPDKMHLMELCEMCKKTGVNCRNIQRPYSRP